VGEPFAEMTGRITFLISLFYLFFALRRVYGQSRRKTGLKLALVVLTYPLIGSLAFLVVIFATILLL
jgi:hypothetical protein